jgi:hypothetical protein
LERFVRVELGKPWAVFAVPTDALPLNAELFLANDGIKICNQGTNQWNDVLVRITTRYEGDEQMSLTKVQAIKPSTCRDVSISEFYSPDWKKIPASPGRRIIAVEVLATVSGRGYSKQVIEGAGSR